MVKEIVVRKTGSSGVFASGSFKSDKMLTIGSSVNSSIRIEDFAPEQLVIVHEDGVPYLLNRGESLEINGESLITGGKAIIKDETRLTVFDYEISFRGEVPESGENTASGSDFFFVNGLEKPRKFLQTSESMWFGQNDGEFRFTDDKYNLDEVFCRVGFDWSGATIFPRRSRKTLLNGDELVDPTPLREGDCVRFQNTRLKNTVACVFNEVEDIDVSSPETPELTSVRPLKPEIQTPVNQKVVSGFSTFEISLLVVGLLAAVFVAGILFFVV